MLFDSLQTCKYRDRASPPLMNTHTASLKFALCIGIAVATNGPVALATTAIGDSLAAYNLENQSTIVEDRVADYYVATTGDDSNPGTEARPFATINEADAVVRPGNLIYVRGGIYTGRTILTASGTRDNSITYQSYPGETAIFQGDAGDEEVPLFWVKSSWLVVKNIEVRRSVERGIYIRKTTHSVFQNIDTYDNNGDGLQLVESNRNKLLAITSHGNYDRATGGENADGINISAGANNLIADSITYKNSDDGMDLFGGVNNKIESCLSYRNGYGTDGDGDGFKLGGDPGSGGNVVRTSMAWENTRRGFDANSATVPLHLAGNFACHNVQVNYNFPGSVAHVLRSNVSCTGPNHLGSRVKQQNNRWYLSTISPTP